MSELGAAPEATGLNFLGVEYRFDPASSVIPPADWERNTYEDGQVIAYTDSEPSLIYVRTVSADNWHEYEGRCYRCD